MRKGHRPEVAVSLFEYLKSKHILVRYFGSHPLTCSFLRVSIGTDNQMKTFNEDRIMAKARTAKLTRNTKETRIQAELNIDGSGESSIDTGIPFFDHMLTLFARHGLFDLTVKAEGDIDVIIITRLKIQELFSGN